MREVTDFVLILLKRINMLLSNSSLSPRSRLYYRRRLKRNTLLSWICDQDIGIFMWMIDINWHFKSRVEFTNTMLLRWAMWNRPFNEQCITYLQNVPEGEYLYTSMIFYYILLTLMTLLMFSQLYILKQHGFKCRGGKCEIWSAGSLVSRVRVIRGVCAHE